MSVVRKGRPPDQGRRGVVGAPGCPAAASDVASAATTQARFAPAATPAYRAVGGELSVLSETVTGVDFDTFYRAERKSLVRFVMWLGCSDAGTADDIAQTAFIRAFPAWETIQFPQAWLRKVAQNEYARYCRAAARETSLDAEPGRADRQAGTSAAMALEQQSDTRDLLAAIADLPPKQRQVMAWHWDGFSDAETAVALGDSTEAVRKNRNRAMKNLRRSLTQVREEGK